MKLIIVLALCVLAVSADLRISEEDRNKILLGLGFGSLLRKRIDIEQHIVGGVNANIADFPYQLSLRQNGNHICGASILSGTWALTAAHCLDFYPAISSMSFRAGSSDRLSGGQIFNFAEYIIHPSWNANSNDNDVAVVRITGVFSGTNIGTVSLAQRDSTGTLTGTSSTVTGWGYTAPGGPIPQILQRVSIPIISNANCNSVWGGINANMICAGEFGRDSCNGDSGGPLTVGNAQVGIVSFGSVQCGDGLPGVYARVAAPSIRDFISSRTGV